MIVEKKTLSRNFLVGFADDDSRQERPYLLEV